MKNRARTIFAVATVIILVCHVSCDNPASGSDPPDDENTTPQTITVSFDSQGGTAVQPQSIAPGSALAEPDNLENADLIFGGWHTEAACTTLWDFTLGTPSQDMTLYAKWNAADALSFTAIASGSAYEVARGAEDPEPCVYVPAFYRGKPVTSIAALAFYNCNSLERIAIPRTIVDISHNAFFYCGGLTNMIVHPENEHFASIDGVLFDKPRSVLLNYPAARGASSYEIPAGVTTLNEFAFLNATSLATVNLPRSLSAILYCAFQDCANMTQIFIPATVTTNARFAFIGCHSLVIACEAASQPASWHAEWNYSNRPVTWGVAP